MEKRQNSNRYESLDGVRALAMIGILLMHYFGNIDSEIADNLKTGSYLYNDLIHFFTQFVYIFFTVSALSMCCGYFHKFHFVDGHCQFDLNSFYIKRYKRIWPFFAFLVLIDLVMKPSLSEFYEGFADLTLAFNLLPNPDIHVIGVAWFVGVIFLFYMLFPWFIFLLQNKRRAWFSMAVAFVFNIILMQYFMTDQFCTESQMEMPRMNFIYSFPFMMAGGLLYLYQNKVKMKMIKWAAAILSFLGTIAQFLWEPALFGDNHLYLLFLFCAWIIVAMNYNGKLLNNRFMHFLGGLSMEVYLCHMVMFRFLEKIHIENYLSNNHLFYWTTCLIGLCLAILFSWAFKTSTKKWL